MVSQRCLFVNNGAFHSLNFLVDSSWFDGATGLVIIYFFLFFSF
jgi:hypothetical protein